MKTYDILTFCHMASVAESYSYICQYGKYLRIEMPVDDAPDSQAVKLYRERLFPGFTQSASDIIALQFPNFPPPFFNLRSDEIYSNIQGSLTTCYHSALQTRISGCLEQPSYKGWFEGGKEQYTSFTLNSQVRHITFVKPPHDGIFKFVLSMRVLRPLFFNVSCKCGATLDFCGHHAIRCPQSKPFTKIHHSVRDGVFRWMENYIKRQHNSPMKSISEKQSSTQCKVSHYYPITSHPTGDIPTSGRHADGILWFLNDPMRPWVVDFVQTQTTSSDATIRLRDLERKHNDKLRTYADSHPTIPLSRIVPFAFTSDGIIHPKADEFMNRFICKAASEELMEPPSKEQISFRHTFMAALQDKTASCIASSFESHLRDTHAALFPLHSADTPTPLYLYAPLPFDSPSLHDSISSSPPLHHKRETTPHVGHTYSPQVVPLHVFESETFATNPSHQVTASNPPPTRLSRRSTATAVDAVPASSATSVSFTTRTRARTLQKLTVGMDGARGSC